MISVVLIEPEIPQNAGNIVRTCAATGCDLYMVRPLGFEVSDKHYKRAGLDYWQYANVRIVGSFDELYESNKDKHFYFASTKSQALYSEADFTKDCFIVFGKETAGIDENILNAHYKDCIRIPMIEQARSLNLSNSVAIIVYEAMRQNNFESLQNFGHLTKF